MPDRMARHTRGTWRQGGARAKDGVAGRWRGVAAACLTSYAGTMSSGASESVAACRGLTLMARAGVWRRAAGAAPWLNELVGCATASRPATKVDTLRMVLCLSVCYAGRGALVCSAAVREAEEGR